MPLRYPPRQQGQREPSWEYRLMQAKGYAALCEEGLCNHLARVQKQRGSPLLFINPDGDTTGRDAHLEQSILAYMDAADEAWAEVRAIRREMARRRIMYETGVSLA